VHLTRTGHDAAERDSMQTARPMAARGWFLIYRHSVVVRITHWINVVCMTILLMSGLQIFNARPDLYWGQRSHWSHPLLAMGAEKTPSGKTIGVTKIFGHSFTTTGVLGLSTVDGASAERGFPSWATLPAADWLAMGRRWHFFFAWLFVINGVIYALYSLLSRHLWRDLVPSRADLRHIGRSIGEHARLRFPKGEEARHYNVLQRLAYLVVLFVLVPVIILAGLTMSPTIDAGYPWLLTLFGGRQSARTIHFVCAFSLLGFVAIHIVMVLVSGVWNNLRSMVTGRYAIEELGPGHDIKTP
jgi:thiosulfate reductase cytochrome b subunit